MALERATPSRGAAAKARNTQAKASRPRTRSSDVPATALEAPTIDWDAFRLASVEHSKALDASTILLEASANALDVGSFELDDLDFHPNCSTNSLRRPTNSWRAFTNASGTPRPSQLHPASSDCASRPSWRHPTRTSSAATDSWRHPEKTWRPTDEFVERSDDYVESSHPHQGSSNPFANASNSNVAPSRRFVGRFSPFLGCREAFLGDSKAFAGRRRARIGASKAFIASSRPIAATSDDSFGRRSTDMHSPPSLAVSAAWRLSPTAPRRSPARGTRPGRRRRR
jgi:hypothetical protein